MQMALVGGFRYFQSTVFCQKNGDYLIQQHRKQDTEKKKLVRCAFFNFFFNSSLTDINL